jgi:PAS domain S-box-containing protein
MNPPPRRSGRSKPPADRPLKDTTTPSSLLETFFELSSDLFCIATFDGYFERINPAWESAFGYSRVELMARPILDFVHPDDRTATMRAAAALAQGRETMSFENRCRSADGSYRWLRWNARARVAERRVYATARDVTARKADRQRLDELNATLRDRTAQLEAANRELEAFSYSVSHDLRAPLRAIVGFSQVLEDDQGGLLDPPGREALRRVRAAARRMGTLIDGLLALARLTRAELTREPFDLAGMARTIVAEFARHEPSRTVELIVPDRLDAKGDSALLRIALQNLLHNAWKYTSRTTAARIELGVLGEGTAIPVFFVRDNGAGFDMRYASRLFGAFQRLHSEQEFEGSGIGLATVLRIIRRHGGRVWGEGEVGSGATFYFTVSDGEQEEGKDA